MFEKKKMFFNTETRERIAFAINGAFSRFFEYRQSEVFAFLQANGFCIRLF